LLQSGIYSDEHKARVPEPENAESIRQALNRLHSSLSAQQLTQADFASFKETNATAAKEAKVMGLVYPILFGTTDSDVHSGKDDLMANLCKFHESITSAKPNIFDGVPSFTIHQRVLADLHDFILPSRGTAQPAASNNFVELRGHGARSDVVKRQVLYDGAVGARAMFVLQNYGRAQPVYDSKAYTIASCYLAGMATLELYAMHPFRCLSSGRTEFQLTLLTGVYLKGGLNSFIAGVSALRNARDFCRRQRDALLKSARLREILGRPRN